nr:hypothetical protein [uncultured Halomonas sp.]
MAKLLEYEERLVGAACIELERNMPKGASPEYVAFVVWLPETDEFLNDYRQDLDAFVFQWAKGLPELAKRFTRLKRAESIACQKDGAKVVALFETNRKYAVIELDKGAEK